MRRTSRSPSRRSLQVILQDRGLQLTERQFDLLWRYYVLLERRNPELDLTRIRSFQDIVIKHFLDCAIVAGLIELPSPLLDIGTGAGFPGVVLKIVQPELDVVLAEPRHKRVSFLRELIRDLELSGTQIYPHKIVGSLPMQVAGIITRAVEPIVTTLNRSVELLTKGGTAIFMKGPSVDPEIRDAARKLRGLFTIEQDIPYVLPGTPYRRRLVVCRRIG
jgi:16S rRNA (guanine527-N7)-methyltransferase